MRIFDAVAVALAVGLLAPNAVARPQALSASDYARAERLHEAHVAALVDSNRPVFKWSANGRTLDYQINEGPGMRYWRIDPSARTRIEIAKPAERVVGVSDTLASPDGRNAAFVRDQNLWLRRGTTERQLTHDGARDFAYGTPPDYLFTAIPRIEGRLKAPPSFVSWSPDSRFLFGQRYDQRAVKPYPYVASTPADGDVRPRVFMPRIPIVGDAEQPVTDYYLIDTVSGETRSSAGLPDWEIDATTIQWSTSGGRAWMLASGKGAGGPGGALLAFDPISMTFTVVVSERHRGFFVFNAGSIYNAANVRILGDGREAIWFSSRDGWGNLYLYDLRSGRLKRQLTKGPGVVLDIVGVDETKRRVYFTGGGRGRARDPYLRQLYSVSLDGGRVTAITDDDRDHEIAGPIAPLYRPFFRAPPGVGALSPDYRWFADTASALDQPPIVSLRALDTGRVAMELDRADPSRFLAAGGRMPQRFSVKASDGATDLWGAIWLPPGYDPAKHYPLIDGIYAGPQVFVSPRTWNEGSGARPQMFDRNSLAELGFVVVTLDGRGTPGRSAAFQDVSYGNFADPQLDDHVAAIRQLAVRYRGIDLTRIGVFGHSFGGYTSTRALLRYPNFYKVAVSSAGVHAWERLGPAYSSIFGPPGYAGGATVRPDAKTIAANLIPVDNTLLADQLAGKLLLAYGELDENAPPHNTLAMVDALTRANKPYDLIVLPNTTHSYGTLNYFTARLWGYFVEHLLGATPPPDYRFGKTPAR